MVKEIQYTSISKVLSNLMDHPMLQDLTMEQVVRYTIRFIDLHGFPRFYQDKSALIEIQNFRGLLPCDLVSVIQVKDTSNGCCLRSMTDNFSPDESTPGVLSRSKVDESFKVQGRVLFTSFKEGCVNVAYKSIPVDDEGFPMIIDNENFLAALEAYIKKTVFTIKFDQGKLSHPVLQNANYEYGQLCAQLNSEFLIPSVSEMQSIVNMFSTLIPGRRQFETGFRNTGAREFIRKL